MDENSLAVGLASQLAIRLSLELEHLGNRSCNHVIKDRNKSMNYSCHYSTKELQRRLDLLKYKLVVS